MTTAIKAKKKKKVIFSKTELAKFMQETALPFALYFLNNIKLLQNYIGPVIFGEVGPYEQLIQAYLTTNADRNHENQIHGIFLVFGIWPNAKGRRLCIYVVGEGPLFEALGTNLLVQDFVRDQNKTRIIKKVCRAVSGRPSPPPKGVHFHPHVKAKTNKRSIREEITADHGLQYAVAKQSDLFFFKLGVKDGELTWVTATAEDIQAICNRTIA